MTGFISLHNHTYYSLLDSLIAPKDLFLKAKELGQTAIAITDHGTLAANWDAFKAAKDVGVKYIVGYEAYFSMNLSNEKEKLRHLILLAKNYTGYKNLLWLHRFGFDNFKFNGKKSYSILTWEMLEQHSEGLICLTSCGNGLISSLIMEKRNDEAETSVLRLKSIFGDNLGLEVQANNLQRFQNHYSGAIEQGYINRHLIMLGKKHGIKIVPTCNTHYLNKADHDIHDGLLAIGSHQTIYSNARLKYSVPDFYLKSGDEIKSFFSRNYGEAFAQELCDNSVYFANLCEEPEWVDPKYSNPSGKELPSFDYSSQDDYGDFKEWLKDNKNGWDDESLYLKYKSVKNFDKFNFADREKYYTQMEYELDVFAHCKISGYMLIVADFINWAKNNNISIGPGRGSAGSSLVSYLLGIHIVDPIKYGLVFERFHSKLRTDFADIDVDIEKSKRHLVQEYLVNKYGETNVAHVANIIWYSTKVYVKDIARICEFGGDAKKAVEIGNNISEIIPKDPDVHTKPVVLEVLKKIPLYVEYEKKYPQLVRYEQIYEQPRSMGTHAAGIVISNRPLHEIVPVRKDKDGNVILEYDKDTAGENGMVKMDLLGIETLDIIEYAKNIIKKQHNIELNVDCEQFDQKTYDLISSGDTMGVFQFGTSVTTADLCKKIKPDCMEDLAIITALARPGSKDIREEFIETKNGIKNISLFHPLLANALNGTYGYALYDESLLVLANDVAGWDLAEADKLRKLTKEKGKNPKKVKQWKAEFIEGAKNNNVPEESANRIWEKVIEPLGKYSFNKSHAVEYSFLSFYTAYLKAHYPTEFLISVLMSELGANKVDSKVNIIKLKNELRQRGAKILPPNINESNLSYKILSSTELLTGLKGIKGVGDDAIEDIVQKRPFKDFFDFMHRADSSKVRANAIQALIAVGCFDSFNMSRRQMFQYCSDYRKKLQVWLKKHNPETSQFNYKWVPVEEWSISEIFALETKFLGESFSCKPYRAYGTFFSNPHYKALRIKKMKDKDKLESVRGIVVDTHEFKVKKETSEYFGQPMLKCRLEDMDGNDIVITIFSKNYEEVKKLVYKKCGKRELEVGMALNIGGVVNEYNDEIGVVLNQIYDIVPPPPLPADIKDKKTTLKSDAAVPVNLEELEDQLILEGAIVEENDLNFDD